MSASARKVCRGYICVFEPVHRERVKRVYWERGGVVVVPSSC